jgi:ribonuclease E
MNDLEQEIYALMGVSPLVYADQGATDPKSVLVYVKKPGQEITEEELATETTGNGKIESGKTSKKLKTKGKKPKVKVELEPETEAVDEESGRVLTREEALGELEAVLPEAILNLETVKLETTEAREEPEIEKPEEEEPETEEAEVKNGRRRRRRRSSAHKEAKV